MLAMVTQMVSYFCGYDEYVSTDDAYCHDGGGEHRGSGDDDDRNAKS